MQLVGKSCSENLNKIHSEHTQTSKIELFAKIVNS